MTEEERRKRRCEVSKRSRLNHLEKSLSRERKYKEDHREEINKRAMDYHRIHRETQNEYKRNLNKKHKEQNIKWLLDYLMVEKVSCNRCGYNRDFGAIEGHHLNPEDKKSRVDSFGLWLLRAPKFFIEKVKTIPIMFLCGNCHKELHDGLWQIGGKNE
jgi:hypothetical protein